MGIKPQYQEIIGNCLHQVATGADISSLPHATRTVVCVHAAQGLLDNGGLQYFFESDFPGKPPYSRFVEAYQSIGANAAAGALEKAVALFPFKDAHTSAKRRNRFLDSFKDPDGDPLPGGSPFDPLTNILCGNQHVWPLLERFVDENFGKSP